jgi:hypothetical protein
LQLKSFEVYRAFDQSLRIQNYHEWLSRKLRRKGKAGPKRNVDFDRRALRDLPRAERIQVDIPVTVWLGDHRRTLTVKYRPRKKVINVFLELSPQNFVGPLASESVFRGLWLRGHQNLWVIGVFHDSPGREPKPTAYAMFEWERKVGYRETGSLGRRFGSDLLLASVFWYLEWKNRAKTKTEIVLLE